MRGMKDAPPAIAAPAERDEGNRGAHAMPQNTRLASGEQAGRRPPIVSVEERRRRRQEAEASAKVTAEMIAKAKASRPRLGEWEEEV